jgi:hypothetical protein
MSDDRLNYYSKRCHVSIWDPKNPDKGFSVRNVLIENCLERHDITIHQTIDVDCPTKSLMKLLQMMKLTRMVEIKESRGEKTTICVTASDYTCDVYISAIKKIVKDSYNPNLSKSDAEAIITKLNLSSLVYCIESDDFGCLVVLKQVDIYAYSTRYQEQPFESFQREVSSLNLPRTIIMTPAQCDTLLSEKMKSSIEFRSVLPDRNIQLVFKREAIPTVVPEIKKQVEINNLRRRLEELTSSK